MTTKLIDHPNYDKTIIESNRIIVCFKVGHYAPPPTDVMEAWHRIKATIAAIPADDKRLTADWHGQLIQHQPVGRYINPPLSEEMRQQFLDAATHAFPGKQITTHWNNSMHGIDGYSVAMTESSES